MTVDEFLDGSASDAMPVRQMAYGPLVGETHHDAMFGPNGNALNSTDVAASPDTGLQQKDLIMAQDGSLHTVNDWSYLKPGVPTHHTIEFRDRKDQGYGTIQKISSIDDFLGKPAEKQVDVGTITDEQGNVIGLPGKATKQSDQVANLPPEEQGLHNILEKNLQAGATAGVYPKAEAATAEDRWAQLSADQPKPQQSFQEKVLGFLEGKVPLTEAIKPIGTAIARSGLDELVTQPGQTPYPLIGTGFIPHEEREATGVGQIATKAAYNTIADIVNFANTPGGAATIMAGGGLPKAGQQLMSLGFGALGVKNALDAAMQGDWAGALEGLGIGAMGAKGAHDIGKTIGKEGMTEAVAATQPEAAPIEQPTAPTAPTAQVPEPVTEAAAPSYAPPPPRVNPETGFTHYPTTEEAPPIVESETARVAGVKPPDLPVSVGAKTPVESWLEAPPATALPITQDEYARQIQSESAAKGDSGQRQQLASAPEERGVATPGTPATGLYVGEPLGISQARTETELGEGSVIPGAGAELGSGLAYGRDYINKGGDPRLPIRRALASGLVGKNEVGVVHAELERLRGIRNEAATRAAEQPDNVEAQTALDVADSAQRAWRRELQPVLTKASDALREAYSESTVPDLGSYQGLVDLVDQHFNGQREIAPTDRTELQKVSNSVRRSKLDLGLAVNRAAEATAKRAKRVMTPDELTADFKNTLDAMFKDCWL